MIIIGFLKLFEEKFNYIIKPMHKYIQCIGCIKKLQIELLYLNKN